MTDDRLRALERRFRETGIVEDEAAWLTERSRKGELTPEQIEAAAYLGYAPAAALFPDASPLEPLDGWETFLASFVGGSESDLEEDLDPSAWARQGVFDWVRGLRSFGEPLVVRVGLAATFCCLRAQSDALATPSPFIELEEADFPAATMVARVEDWILCPCRPCGVSAGHATPGSQLCIFHDEYRDHWQDPTYADAWVYAAAELLATTANMASNTEAIVRRHFHAEEYVQPVVACAHKALWFQDPHSALKRVFGAIQAEVIPWVFGSGDPVRDRVEARQWPRGLNG